MIPTMLLTITTTQNPATDLGYRQNGILENAELPDSREGNQL